MLHDVTSAYVLILPYSTYTTTMLSISNLNFLSKGRKKLRAASHPSDSVSISAEAALQTCVCSGWMVKEGGNVKTWKHRFVVLGVCAILVLMVLWSAMLFVVK